jgi:hypothetical protein
MTQGSQKYSIHWTKKKSIHVLYSCIMTSKNVVSLGFHFTFQHCYWVISTLYVIWYT